MASGQAIHDLISLTALREAAPFYCWTRSGAVKSVGYETVLDWFVGKNEQGFVEWLFVSEGDCLGFHQTHGKAVFVRGKYS